MASVVEPNRKARYALALVVAAVVAAGAGVAILSQRGGEKAQSVSALAGPPEGQERLTSRRDFGRNHHFEAPEEADRPRLSRAKAWEAWQASGMITNAQAKAKGDVEVLFTRYTGEAGKIEADGSVTREIVRRPVWALIFHGYPSRPNGALNGITGETIDTTLVIAIDDATGQVLFTTETTDTGS